MPKSAMPATRLRCRSPSRREQRRELRLEPILRQVWPHRFDYSQPARLGLAGPQRPWDRAQHEVAEERPAIAILEAARYDAQRAGEDRRHVRVLPLGYRPECDPGTLNELLDIAVEVRSSCRLLEP